MRESFLFDTLAGRREKMLEAAGKCPEDKRNAVPAGFNNSVHWQLGHIVAVTDGLVFGLSGEERTVPEHYWTFFGNGTKPADWTGEPPEWDEIVACLKDQMERIRSRFAGRLDASAKENSFKCETVEELLIFNLFHESVHAGNMAAMVKIVSL